MPVDQSAVRSQRAFEVADRSGMIGGRRRQLRQSERCVSIVRIHPQRVPVCADRFGDIPFGMPAASCGVDHAVRRVVFQYFLERRPGRVILSTPGLVTEG